MNTTSTSTLQSIPVVFTDLSTSTRKHTPRYADSNLLAIHAVEVNERPRSTTVEGKALIWSRIPDCTDPMGSDTQACREIRDLFRRLADDVDFSTDVLSCEEPRVEEITTLQLQPGEFLAWVTFRGQTVNEDRIADQRESESRERFVRMTGAPLF